MSTPFVSILMLTHNAPDYVRTSIDTIRERTNNVQYEIVVVDNASDEETRHLVKSMEADGRIDKLFLSDVNTLFSKGNNIAASFASRQATHYLLANSDIEVKSKEWLSHLLQIHKRGITAYGIAPDPDRVDGYCLLIDADLYQQHGLSVSHEWWWAVTKLQAQLLSQGFSVQGYSHHEQHLHHFGGKSGSGFENAKGLDVSKSEVLSWFKGRRATILDLPAPTAYTRFRRYAGYGMHRVKMMLKRRQRPDAPLHG